jgi:hypothetical protein
MGKMYYSEQEACEKLKVDHAGLMKLARDGRLRAYADGANKMFKVSEVDPLSGTRSGESDIQLAPVDLSATGEAIDLSKVEADRGPAGKGDTVITSEGISIFDDEELEIAPADPMAKTQIAPSLEEQIGLEGVSSGSGLLDLTRESDDTSLGAEVLDHIDMESGEVAAPSVESVAESIETPPEEAPMVIEVPAGPEQIDPAAAPFVGLAAAGAVLMLLLAVVAVPLLTGKAPAYVQTMKANLLIVLACAVVVAVAGGVVGALLGKSAMDRMAAARRA